MLNEIREYNKLATAFLHKEIEGIGCPNGKYTTVFYYEGGDYQDAYVPTKIFSMTLEEVMELRLTYTREEWDELVYA